MRHLVRLLTLAACAALGPAIATRLGAQQAQQPVPAQTDSRLRVFLDCDYCDFDFMRTEITFVDHVRNRQDSQVHILVTDQTTGGGGREFTLHFIGQRDLASLSDTLKYVSPPAASEDSRRRGLARIIKLGLVRYAARRSDSDRLEITYKVPAKSDAKPTGPSSDRWNFWVFRTSASGYGSGEKTSNFVSLNGSFSATRTTEAWKTRLGLNGNYGQSRFIFGDGERFNSYSHSYGFSELIVRSLSPHWSAGQRASWTSSTFLNQRRAIYVAPAVEYNFFPYAQSTRRQFTLQYAAGVNSFGYRDTTIYNRLSEVRGSQTLTASLGLKQPWGSISSSLEGAAYLDDFSQNHLIFFNSLDLKLFKGFSFFLFGQTALLHDQLYVPRGRLSDEQRLLRRRQLETSYTYFVNLGLSYSFGSIFNNIVNPRFGGSSGGISFFN